jgi:hypothetical protein
MILLLILLVILLLIVYTFLRIKNNNERFTSFPTKMRNNKHKQNFIENFMAYPNKQKFCPNLYKSNAKIWTHLPKKYGSGLYVKFCCSTCYYKVSKSIVCGKNKGIYKICKLKKSDLDNLQEYYDKHRLKLDFKFSKIDLDTYVGKSVLKYKHNSIYYPIQILKKKTEMNYKDITDNSIYRTDYKCGKVPTKVTAKVNKK